MTLYTAAVFAATWLAWWTCAQQGAAGGWIFALGGPVFLLGVFAPAVVAVALTAHCQGGRGVAALLSRIGRWDAAPRLYLFALVYMAAIKLLAAAVHRALTGGWPAFGETPVVVMLGAIVVSTWVQAGEELGWRGYALPRLAGRLGLGGAAVVLGVIWALWHLPLFLIPGSGSDGQSFPIYLLYVTAVSVAMAWLYWRSGGSLLMVMLMHAAVNNTIGVVPAALPHPVPVFSLQGSVVVWSTVALGWAVAAVLLARMRGARIEAMIDEPSLRPTTGASIGSEDRP